jgi:HEAT repeat protein
MTKRRAFWLLTLLLALAALALLLPSSPAYAPRLFARYVNNYDGHGAGYWTGALNDPDPKVREHAIFALGAIGKDAEEAVPALAAIMENDDNELLRIEASLALTKMGPAARGAIPSLGRALKDNHQLVRLNAARALMNLGPEARPAIPALIEAMKDEENQKWVSPFGFSVQEVAAVALGRASTGTDEGVLTLIEALDGARTPGMRRAAARALGDVGPGARPAVPHLRALLADDSPDLRFDVETALRKLGEEPTPPG